MDIFAYMPRSVCGICGKPGHDYEDCDDEVAVRMHYAAAAAPAGDDAEREEFAIGRTPRVEDIAPAHAYAHLLALD